MAEELSEIYQKICPLKGLAPDFGVEPLRLGGIRAG